jgi:hypothetical protein
VPEDPTDRDASEPDAELPPGFAPGRASVRAPRAGDGPKRPPRRGGAVGDPAPSNGSAGTVDPIAPPATATAVLEPAGPLASGDGTAVPEPTVTPVATTSAPAPATSGRRRVRRGRRVKRVVRRIDLWSVLKLSLVVYTCLYLATLATLAVLWKVLYESGTIEKLQSFLEDVGLENFTFYGNQMFRACAAIGAIGVMAGTVITVLATALVNVISELTGGIRLVVIEEDPKP